MVIKGDYFVIQKADQHDIENIYHVYKKCEDFLSLGPMATASTQMVLNDFRISEEEGGIYCAIIFEGKVIGVIDFIMSDYEGNHSHAYLSLLMISENYRGRGIGKDVAKAVEQEILKNNSIQSIFASVQVNNPHAINFWEKLGYRIVSGPQLMPDTTITYKLQKRMG